MIIKEVDVKYANECDKLLTNLIREEKEFDDSIDESFIVNNYFINIIKKPTNLVLGAYVDEKLVGYIYMKKLLEEKLYFIDGLYVLKDYRNNGYAKELIKKCISYAKEYKYIDINTMYQNKIAFNLYKSFGFNEFRITLRKNVN